MKCKNCGIDNHSDAQFCRGCGRNLSKTTSKWFIIGGSVFALLAIFIIANIISPGEGPDNVNYNNDRAVDLGLSVKWASCNLGASSSEEYGDYCGYSNSH